MTVICRSYSDELEAHRAVERLMELGVEGRGIKVLMGEPSRDAREEPAGSFGDIDRDTVASYPAGVERQRIASHNDLRKLLVDAGLDQATAERDIAAVHSGHTLVLADVG